ncbi:hypothetical protein EMIHUDRAFT_196574 [Emiliania huxleyi CCMP1516]|uniref:U-box domain-containing protein n=2 Tax=Emiliania huxleyi TaxID=2903 RepID=A0A0D3J4C7_EMIH1|nr:hypothetical protein EMIHUDRAFT_196574 [Emiliania huxleyi CCMP1516]EOD18362.1 hypothetical protein EMIHUDRAFT_196574 [Emiliania huxleyi CCMP1516]|eukprot:XP_005770791.1 hypothetical protein EMIHUDRAFT_196574 [Emiliania huxleyi CCMP1516]
MRPGDPMVVRTPTGQDYMAVIPQGVGPVSQFQTILPRSGGTTSGVAAAIGGGDGDGQPHPAVPAGHHVMLVDEPEVAEEEAVELAAALEDSMRLDNQAKGAPKEQGAPSSSAEVAPALKEEEPPADFICPITTEVMAEPVMAADGHSYERRQIERWLTTKSTSPLTGGELEHLFLTPNHSLRRMIREWQEAQR